jgi:hypothetical protein
LRPARHLCWRRARVLHPTPGTHSHARPPQKKGKGKAGKKRSSREADKCARQELRMIKNRESAARSRLRRQQHIQELEEENALLRGQLETAEAQVCGPGLVPAGRVDRVLHAQACACAARRIGCMACRTRVCACRTRRQHSPGLC